MAKKPTGSETETRYFRLVRDFTGKLVPVDLARRNRRLVPRFHPSMLDPLAGDVEELGDFHELVAEVSQNLNPLETRTWLRLLDGMSILDLAKDDRVSRAAIYSRLERMVTKNAY